MRYLGLSLGMAVVLGLCAAFGTLMPPIFRGEFMTQVLGTTSGKVILLGIAVCLLGIGAAGLAGVYKERAMSPEQQKAVIKEFALKKGVAFATLSGVMSACFAYGLAAGDPIKALTLRHGTPMLWQGLPVLVVILIGGFTTNFIWCAALNIRNKTGHQYFRPWLQAPHPKPEQENILETDIAVPTREMIERVSSSAEAAAVLVAEPRTTNQHLVRAPMLANYLFCALAGTTWYFQFFFYTMGETQMGRYKFSSWTLHMASIIIFSSLWGISLKEWKGGGVHAGWCLFFALALLIGSTAIVGYGNYLALLH